MKLRQELWEILDVLWQNGLLAEHSVDKEDDIKQAINFIIEALVKRVEWMKSKAEDGSVEIIRNQALTDVVDMLKEGK